MKRCYKDTHCTREIIPRKMKILFCNESLNTNCLFLADQPTTDQLDTKIDFVKKIVNTIKSRNVNRIVRISKRKKKREYKTYTNKKKIEFFEVASKVGNKKAAHRLKISWSTVKSWVKKDTILRRDHRSYVDILKS